MQNTAAVIFISYQHWRTRRARVFLYKKQIIYQTVLFVTLKYSNLRNLFYKIKNHSTLQPTTILGCCGGINIKTRRQGGFKAWFITSHNIRYVKQRAGEMFLLTIDKLFISKVLQLTIIVVVNNLKINLHYCCRFVFRFCRDFEKI